MLGKNPEAIKARDEKINDLNIQYIVLLQLIIEKIEELEKLGFFVGQIKMFIKNAKSTFERYINNIFKTADADEKDVLKMADSLAVIQERVEKALLNEYAISVDERKRRAREVLSKYMITPMVDNAIKEMQEKNLFNF